MTVADAPALEMKQEGYEPPVPVPLRKRALRIIKGTATFGDRFEGNHDTVKELIAELRSAGCAIAFTTGNWDLFHIGHAKYIQHGRDEAQKHCGDSEHLIMVVGIDSDEFTRSRKGNNRPIVPLNERAEILSHLRAVDVIVPQYEADQLYRLIKHDVRIISQSTTDLPQLDEMKRYCKHLVNLPPQAETSTTARVRRLAIDGVYESLSAVVSEISTLAAAFAARAEGIRRELEGK
jgi:D-glycero-beta-D-manno-heptose 1-phosphate adenylyltransferase